MVNAAIREGFKNEQHGEGGPKLWLCQPEFLQKHVCSLLASWFNCGIRTLATSNSRRRLQYEHSKNCNSHNN